jgi:hypothetical protein
MNSVWLIYQSLKTAIAVGKSSGCGKGRKRAGGRGAHLDAVLVWSFAVRRKARR